MTNGIPNATLINQLRHRRYVRMKDAVDRNNQVRLGLDTFPTDWEHAAKRASPRGTVHPRTVWMCWLQGYAQAPALIRHCIDSWRIMNPDWDVVVLDRSSIPKYITLPDLPMRISPNHFTNILRLELLARYGGVWADATNLCRRPLSTWIDGVVDSGFFAFSQPQPTRPLANWFLAADRNSQLLQAWQMWSKIYITSSFRPSSYFWNHHTFDWLLLQSPLLAALWSKTPRISARGPHIMQRILDRHLTTDTSPTADQLRLVPMFKLSWKKGYTVEDIQNALTRAQINKK